ncbi:MAG: heme-binding domain-containing protein [Sulfurovaceae bacterium]|nr:heme-binding domain-containing protein [Sulfurovaceae bacterium]
MKNLILWGIIPLIAIQFIKLDVTQTLPTNEKEQLKAPKEVTDILNRSCADCHSNHVKYPWYDRIAPATWYVQMHVKKGRKVLNFDKWNSYDNDKKLKILEKIPKAIKIRMPMPSYLWLHQDAKLSTEDKKMLNRWAEDLQFSLE